MEKKLVEIYVQEDQYDTIVDSLCEYYAYELNGNYIDVVENQMVYKKIPKEEFIKKIITQKILSDFQANETNKAVEAARQKAMDDINANITLS